MIPAVLQYIECAVCMIPIHGNHTSNSSGISGPVTLKLTRPVCVELPDAAMCLQLRTGILSGHTGSSLRVLANITWRAERDIHVPFIIKCDRLGNVFSSVLGISVVIDHDHLDLTLRHQLSRGPRLPVDFPRRTELDVAIMDLHRSEEHTSELQSRGHLV